MKNAHVSAHASIVYPSLNISHKPQFICRLGQCNWSKLHMCIKTQIKSDRYGLHLKEIGYDSTASNKASPTGKNSTE